jgi:hypothetical protein
MSFLTVRQTERGGRAGVAGDERATAVSHVGERGGDSAGDLRRTVGRRLGGSAMSPAADIKDCLSEHLRELHLPTIRTCALTHQFCYQCRNIAS